MRRYTIQVAEREFVIDVEEMTADTFRVLVGGEEYAVRLATEEDLATTVISPEIVPVPAAPAHVPVTYKPAPPETLRPLPRAAEPALPHVHPADQEALTQLVAPMPGTILGVPVSPGMRVARGQVLVVLEAMKMKNAIRSPVDAQVTAVLVQVGQVVAYGDVLLRFEA
jgi:biotin carboxyl carrier protein